MLWQVFLAALAGLLGATLGWGLLAMAGYAVLHSMGYRDGDGGLAMTAFFAIGPGGGLLGFLLGSIIALRRRGPGGAAPGLARLPLVIVTAAGVVGAVVIGLWYARSLDSPNSLPPELLFEIRLPAGMAPPALVSRSEAFARISPIELRTSRNTMSAEITAARDDGGRTIVAGRVEIHYRVVDRYLVMKHPADAPEVVFRLSLGRGPAPSTEFGGWQPDNSGGRHEIRYRVVRDGG